MNQVKFFNLDEVTIGTREVSAAVAAFIDSADTTNNALADFDASAIDALAEIFAAVKFAKGRKWSVQAAVAHLRADDGMAVLRGLLYPTHPSFGDLEGLINARDKLPKGSKARTEQQAAITSLRVTIKSRIEYLVTCALTSYVMETLGFDYKSGTKRSPAMQLDRIVKTLTALSKQDKDETVQAKASAALEAISKVKVKGKKAATTLDDVWANRKRNGTVKKAKPTVRRPRKTADKVATPEVTA